MTTPFSPDGFLDHWLRFLPQMPGMGTARQEHAESEDEMEDHASLITIRDFAPNPGALRMRALVPDNLPQGAPLVVLLHGCRQTAAEYLCGSGWATLAERHGFALLLPEQRRLNNPNLCFNWFETGDIARGAGEVGSIGAMIHTIVARHGLDAKRVYITGLSAGGAMANAMLAAYPELFAGGAIIAGLPYGSAASAHEAFGVMGQGRVRSGEELGARVREASAYSGPWAPITLWQGEADPVVNPVNVAELAKQWVDVLGLGDVAPEQTSLDGVERLVWRDAEGGAALTLYRIADLGHAVPINPTAVLPDARIGLPGASAFVQATPISSTWQIAEGWGLVAPGHTAGTPPPPPPPHHAEGAGFWHHLPGADRMEHLAREWAADNTPLGKLLRAGGITPPGRTPPEK
jgi:poly(hydroxyalkanoate) depolymerase family esterase